MAAAMIIPAIVQQHADDVAMLAGNRLELVECRHVKLDRLARFDRRLAANLHGVRLAGGAGRTLCDTALTTPSPGAVFAVAVSALEDHDELRLARVIAFSQAVQEAGVGLLAAFSWVERSRLQGVVAALLADPDGFRRALGLGACAAHGVDPGIAAQRWFQDPDPCVRARSLRAAGELGRRELVSSCAAAIADEDSDVQFWAAWSAVLLGDRLGALNGLIERGLSGSSHGLRSMRLALQALGLGAAHEVLQQIAQDQRPRWVVEGSGIAGDPAYVPWLINQMDVPDMARLAGEAFTLITGMNLGAEALDGPAPQNYESGPTDDPDDPNVDLHADDGLPWPDRERVLRWWSKNGNRLSTGIRHFMGAPVSVAHCVEVLKNGHQRQRILAAHYLCLLEPGAPLFEWRAPAWRQQRLLVERM